MNSRKSQEGWQEVYKQTAHMPERDDKGNFVNALSQYPDVFLDDADSADWMGYVGLHPWIITQMQNRLSTQLDYLLSHVEDE